MLTSRKGALCADLALINGRVLTVVKDGLKRRVRLLCFGAEEIGLYGSYNYVRMHEDELGGLRFMLNLDAAGGEGKKGLIFNDSP